MVCLFDEKYLQKDKNKGEKQCSLSGSTQTREKSLICYKRWTIDQNTVYVNFLRENPDDFCSKESRKSKKVFKRLASLVGTKNPTQCKSHHHKRIKHFGSLQKICAKYLPQRPITEPLQEFPLPPGPLIKKQFPYKCEVKIGSMFNCWGFVYLIPYSPVIHPAMEENIKIEGETEKY